MRALSRLLGLVACGSLIWASSGAADVVTDWNAIATPSIVTGVPTRGGGSAFLDFAVVHLAMHDAIQAF